MQKDIFENPVAEITVTYKREIQASDLPVITDSQSAYDLLYPFFEETIDYREKMVGLFLSRRNRVLCGYVISEGGTCGTVCDPKVLFSAALKVNALGIIVAHNHPSGLTDPSNADKELTKRLKMTGKMLDLPILDHIILGRDQYFSFADNKLL